MPIKKGTKKSVVKKRSVDSKLKVKKSVKSLPKVSLKSQPVLVRRSITYVFVSSLLLFFFVNAFPNVVSSIFYPNLDTQQVLGESDRGKGSEIFESKVNSKNTSTPNTKMVNNENKTMTRTQNMGEDANIIEKTMTQEGKNSTDIKSSTMSQTGVENKFEFKDKNGAVVMLKVREGDNSWSHLLYNEKNGMLLIKQKGNPTVTPSINITLGVTPKTTPVLTPDIKPLDDEINSESTEDVLAIKINEGGTFDLIKGNVSATTNLPVEVDGEQGKVYVNDTEVNFDPEEVVNTAKTTEGVDTVETVSITKQNGVTTYMLKGVDSQKFLGVFDVTIPKTLYYSVDTNTMVSSSKTLIQNVIDAFSF